MRIQERGQTNNISEDKRSSGMAPMSETCKETPRTSSPLGRVLEIWHEACYPDFFVPTSINFYSMFFVICSLFNSLGTFNIDS